MMTLDQFRKRIEESVPVGTTFENPRRGKSKITGYANEKISYQRKNSTIYVKFEDLYSAYSHFKGQRVSSNDLKTFASAVFDSKSNGHSCNCTIFFMILKASKIITAINGTGKRGDPFWIYIPELPQ